MDRGDRESQYISDVWGGMKKHNIRQMLGVAYDNTVDEEENDQILYEELEQSAHEMDTEDLISYTS